MAEATSAPDAGTPSRFGLRIALGAGLALLSAALFTVAFPPYAFWPLIFVAAVPFLIAQYRVLPRRWSSLAPAIAIGGWIGAYFTKVFGLGGAGAWYMRLLPLLVAAFVFLAERGNRALHERSAYRWFVVQGVVGWIGFEMLRTFVPNMGTWAFVGYPLYAQLRFIQPVSIVGILGLDLLIMAVNFVLAQLALRWFDRHLSWDAVPDPDPRLTRAWAAGTLAALVAWTGLSLALFHAAPSANRVLRVAAIQPNLPRAAHMDRNTPAEKRLETLAAQTREAAAMGAQVVVWPELGLGFDPQQEHTERLRALAAQTGAHLVIGYGLDTPDGFRNEATVLAPDGAFLGLYGKAHPTVFGGEPYGINAGTFPVYDTPEARLATIICFDLDFTDASRHVAAQGAQLVAAPSLDFPGIAEIHYTQMVLRAIENRVAMVKADAAFNSAVVDPYGRVLGLVAEPTGTQAVVVADVPLGTGRTLYARLGDWIGWLSLAGMLFFMLPNPVLSRPRGRQSRSSS